MSVQITTLTEEQKIVEEIERVLVSKPIKDSDCVSLYDVDQLMKIKRAECLGVLESYGTKINSKINLESLDIDPIYIKSFNYDLNELSIAFDPLEDDENNEIVFSKDDNGNLYMKKDSICFKNGNKVMDLLNVELSEIYDLFIQYKDFIQQCSRGITSVNSWFLVDIDLDSSKVFAKNEMDDSFKEFQLCSFPGNYYGYGLVPTAYAKYLVDNEEEMFKRIFVKIEDCPQWTQPILGEERKSQLSENKKNNVMTLSKKIIFDKKNNPTD